MVLMYRPMKLPAVLLSTLLLAPTVALAEHTYDPGGSSSRKCFKSEYKEEYIPGTEDNPGYVRSSKETVEVACDPDDVAEGKTYQRTVTVYENVDTNDCSDGTVAGALLGGGLAGFGSRGKDRWWAIPSGIIGGAMVGCAVDGG